ncbi:MAG: hypothetical protein JWO60_3372 [Frankiales bacterium]|nr:hypothetical protein [Frankiales bacterium]
MSVLLGRLAGVPAFTLAFVQLCLLQAGVDRVDPTAGALERTADLLLLAFAVSGLVVAVAREPGPPQTGSALAGLLLRSGLVGAAALLLVLLLQGGTLNPLGDLQFVVALLLLTLTTLRYAYDPTARTDAFLARWAVPAGGAVLLLSVPVTVAKLMALP